MDEHCRGCIRYMKSCSGMSKRLCEKHKLRIPITNADRIRTMTDEELADKFEEIQLNTVKAYGNDHLLLKGELKKYWLEWLRQEVDHD